MEKLNMDELNKLRRENKKLKKILKDLGYIYIDDNFKLNKEQRLNVFIDYFKGRSDVYASKYFSKKNNRYEYSFVCKNKFLKRVCLITENKKCSINCQYYQPAPLDKNTYLAHLTQENNAIGIYPILEDNTCYFLAIDFDGDLWFENLLSVYRSAKKYSISSIMERSQSGNGGHLWIFFETAIKATKARKLGDFLLKDAMNSNKHLSFESFDRMFPNQDYLNGAGLGNLIALPLQHDKVLMGNTIFINELQTYIPKPFEYLYATGKVREDIIDKIINNKENSLEEFIKKDDNSLNSLNKITSPIELIEDSLLHISKKQLDTQALLTIRRISTIYNPKFYENLRNHLSVFQIPRTLCENIENDYEIAIPRGLKPKLLELINKESLNYCDNRFSGNDIDVSFTQNLYPNQLEAVNELLKYEIATLNAIPGFGKTVIALYLLATIKKSTLIIVNSKDLLEQWKRQIDNFINYPKTKKKREHYIGIYYGNKKNLKYHIDIALIQSLSRIKDKNIINKYGLVLIDECHHASSNTYRSVLRYITAKNIYSFTGTIKRKDRLEAISAMYLGNVAYQVDRKKEIQKRTYEQFLIPRITTFKVIDNTIKFTDIVNTMVENEKRNYLIVNDIISEMKNKKNIIILTDRKKHIDILYNKLKYYDYPTYCISGDTTVKERKIITNKLNEINGYILIATSQLIGEGFDLPSLNTMFITMPLSFEGRLLQYIGRLHRNYQNQKYVTVYDYVDANVSLLQNMFQKRLKTYKMDGYKIIEENKEKIELNQIIFDKATYEYYLHSNMSRAKKYIIIYASSCKINRIQKLYPFLTSILTNGIKIYLVLNKKYDQDIYEYLNGICNKILHSNNYINAIIIDDKEVWTSSSSYLGIQSNELFYIKSNDKALIEELILQTN